MSDWRLPPPPDVIYSDGGDGRLIPAIYLLAPGEVYGEEQIAVACLLQKVLAMFGRPLLVVAPPAKPAPN